MASRIETARLRADKAKRGLVVIATAGFVAVMLLARDSHIGSASTASSKRAASGTAATAPTTVAPTPSASFGAPTGPPQVQTSVS